tara:strand:+ start:205 stop:702 length:498 start_codon:yes stop_codon:yes gene_type:complete
MLITLKNNLHWICFSVSLIIYFVFLAQMLLLWSVVWLLFALYTWLIIALILKQYVFKQFLYLLCSSGIWVSISWFFIKGVEEVPLPRGAFIFKTEGIIPSVILFMLFTIPLIIYHFSSQVKHEREQPLPTKKIKEQPKNNKLDSADPNWEEASIEDIESGDYEVI